MKIFKEELPMGGNSTVFELELPTGTKILNVQLKGLTPCMWYMFNESVSTTEKRSFEIVGTNDVFEETASMQYLGTYVLEKSESVFHLFEV